MGGDEGWWRGTCFWVMIVDGGRVIYVSVFPRHCEHRVPPSMTVPVCCACENECLAAPPWSMLSTLVTRFEHTFVTFFFCLDEADRRRSRDWSIFALSFLLFFLHDEAESHAREHK